MDNAELEALGREKLTYDELVRSIHSVRVMNAKLKKERDDLHERERVAILHLRGTLNFMDGVSLDSMSKDVTKQFHQKTLEYQEIRKECDELRTRVEELEESVAEHRGDADRFGDRVEELEEENTTLDDKLTQTTETIRQLRGVLAKTVEWYAGDKEHDDGCDSVWRKPSKDCDCPIPEAYKALVPGGGSP